MYLIQSWAAVSLSPPENGDKKANNEGNSPVFSDIPEVYFTNKSFVWLDNRENELENRLEKLNKILSEIKEEKIQKIKDNVAKWQSKYEKRLLDLEQSMLNFEKKCKYEKVDLNEQISRVEEMSDTNVAVRQRIEKKLVAYGAKLKSGQNQRFLTVIVNMLRGLLYYMAQFRDTFLDMKHISTNVKD
ncbi:unnamed protein product, partial [Strongylus vulgaris]